MDTLLPNQGLDGDDEDPNRNGGGGGGGGKGNGTPYQTSSEHRDHSKKWHGSKKATVEDRRCTANGMLSQDRQITEAQVTQVIRKVSTIALFDGIITQLTEYPACKAASDAGMAAVDGIGTDEGTTAPTHGPGDAQGEETEDRDAEGDDEEDEEDDEDAVNALIAELQAIVNSANPPQESSKGREL